MLLSMCRVTMDNLIVPPARFGWNFKAKVNSFVWTTDQSIECIDRNKIGRWQSAHMHTESTRGWLLSLLPTLLLLHLIESIVFLCLSHSSLPVTLSLSSYYHARLDPLAAWCLSNVSLQFSLPMVTMNNRGDTLGHHLFTVCQLRWHWKIERAQCWIGIILSAWIKYAHEV